MKSGKNACSADLHVVFIREVGFVWRQSELAFFGAVTPVAALFDFVEEIMETLVKKIIVPAEQRKKTTLAGNLWYDTLEVYDNRVIGYLNGNQTMTWYFKEYTGIDIVKANMNSQFAQVVFLTGMNAKNRVVGIDFGASQNLNAMNDTNRILFCSGMFSFGKTNDFAISVGTEIRKAFENYKNNDVVEITGSTSSSADEILKYKTLLDQGIITQEEFDAKKKQLLGF